MIPSKRGAFATLFHIAGLGFWAYIMTTKVRELLDSLPSPSVFSVIWLLLWTAGGVYAMYSLLWQIAGREIVVLSGGMLSIKRDVLGMGRTRNYDVARIRNLRASAREAEAARPRRSVGPVGIIAFEHGIATWRFGEGLDEAEAVLLVAELKERCGV